MRGFWGDVRYGWRILRRNPVFAGVAVATLAIGIGANAAIYSMVHAVLLQPLPFPRSDRVLLIWETDANRSVERGVATPAEYLEWRETNHSFQQLAAYGARSVTVQVNGEPKQVWQSLTSANFFRLFETRPVLGRDFTANEEIPGHAQVALLSYHFWQERYGGDQHVLGQSITLSGTPYTIIGVLPQGFAPFGGADYLDVWSPYTFDRSHFDRDDHELVVIGRLRDGVSVRHAQAEMETIQTRMKREYPTVDPENGIRVVRMIDDLNRSVSGALLLLWASVGLVLLIACANLANLMLARAAGRAREIAVRSAIGAGRLRIVRQLLTESGTLALAGGALGIVVGYASLKLLLRAAPAASTVAEITRGVPIRMNEPVLAFTVLVIFASGFIFGLAPAVHASRCSLREALKEGGRGSSDGRQSGKLRSLLVIAETALSLILLVAAGLLIRSFVRVTSTNLGFDPSHVLTAQVQLPEAQYKSPAQIAGFYQSVFERLAAMPGVQSASGVNYLPMTSWSVYRDFDIAGRPVPPPGQQFTSQYCVVEPNYLRTMHISLIEGRDFAPSDNEGSTGVVLINRVLQEQYWPNENPIGKQIRIHPAPGTPYEAETHADWLTIVGVARSTRDWQLGDELRPMLYLPASQKPTRIMRLVLRTAGNPTGAAAALRSAVEEAGGGVPVAFVTSMEALYRASIAPRRMNAILLGILAAIATLLAAVGIYGVVAYGVSQRTHEIGIRLALGATPGDVHRMILAEGMARTAIGLAIGIAGSLWLVRYLQSQLYGVSDRDPLTFVCVSAGLGLVAAAACYIPARRATRIDPLEALREE